MDMLQAPEHLNLTSQSISQEWRRWKQSWDIYKVAVGVDKN